MVPCAQHQITSTLLHTEHMKVCCCLKLHIYSPHFFISIWMIFFTVLFLFVLSCLCKCVALNLRLSSHFHDSWYKHHTLMDWLHILILNSLLLVIPILWSCKRLRCRLIQGPPLCSVGTFQNVRNFSQIGFLL